MAKLITGSIANGYLNTWRNFWEGIDCPILSVSTSGTTLILTVDDTLVINLGCNDENYVREPLSITFNGSSLVSYEASYGMRSTPANITLAFTDKLFYLRIRNQYTSGNNVGLTIVYEKIGDKKYAGYARSDMTDLKNITLIDTDGNSNTRAVIIPYEVAANGIDYAENDVLTISGVKSVVDPNFCACSTISNNSVITFEGQNFYAVGTKSVVKIDE